jgi:hypothetical protein
MLDVKKPVAKGKCRMPNALAENAWQKMPNANAGPYI